MDHSRVKLNRSISASSNNSSINIKSHHNISQQQPNRTFSLMTLNHTDKSAFIDGNTKIYKKKLTKTFSNEDDDWSANVSKYTIENEDKFIYTPVEEKHDIEETTTADDNKQKLLEKFKSILSTNKIIKIEELRDLSWHGTPLQYKSITWKLLLGYLPSNTRRHEQILKQKRQTYKNTISQQIKNDEIIQNTENNKQTWHQINIDIKRTHPDIKLYQFQSVKKSLQRILYAWSIRHSSTGYVQGINDICTTFYQVFLLDYYIKSNTTEDLICWEKIENIDPTEYMNDADFSNLEADTFWCFDRFLESIMDNYVHGQPGILKQVKKLEDTCKRVDPELYQHLSSESVEFFQFAFRWMNCLLMREFPMRVVLRMFDTYIAESSSLINTQVDDDDDARLKKNSLVTINDTADELSEEFSNLSTTNNSTAQKLNDFHVYVCYAFLEKWATTLQSMDFTGIIMFLQSCPTTSWDERDIEMLLSEAYLWQSLCQY